MKNWFIILLIAVSTTTIAQTDCNYTVENTEDGTELKTTGEQMMYEKVFGNSSQFIFFSLTNSGGTPLLNFQLLSKSKDFPQLYCLDKTSKIHLQLTNGKVVTLINALDNQCAGLVYDSMEKNNIRILSSTFLFTKGSLEELEKSTITFIRVKYTTETIDYPIRSELNSETMKKQYFPDKYFMNYLKCIQ
ncbi:hypothetical protein E0W68_05535 [Flavobacterium salilacus subsp. salilacus]|uniref:hypothetical protein n=1 Tax=Flavobacterium TaxID=237 RepID=UPI0010754A3E|nr:MULTISPECIES: hypothetical protein [Flavobacterium]KAF2519231.1 hypothetical protein E0W68_05535 [Flavobacterium salilacus subsp. salilacus]MBE1613412.1 hypothetical protein [Flavobacterium sp. SaA2.13]